MTVSLDGWTVVVTRAEGRHGRLGSALALAGARVLHVPTVEIGPPDDDAALVRAVERLESYDWIVFTSSRAVDVLSDLVDVPPGGPKVAAVGPSTAARAEEAGFPVAWVGDGSGGEALGEALVEKGIGEGTSVFFPTSSRGRPELGRVLSDAGARVRRVVAYETRIRVFDPAAVPGLSGADVVTFTSPSAVEGWHSAVGEDPARFLSPSVRYVVIGATTGTAAAERGIDVVEAEEASFDGIVDAVRRLARRDEPTRNARERS